jgi:hypothetical protein
MQPVVSYVTSAKTVCSLQRKQVSMAILPVTLSENGLFAAQQLGIISTDEARAAIGLDPLPAIEQTTNPDSAQGLSLV